MDFVGAISHRMSSAEREALANAVEQVEDFLLSELVKLHDDTEPARTRMFSCPFLPTRSADLYDFAMLRRLYVRCRTFQDQWEPPRSSSTRPSMESTTPTPTKGRNSESTGSTHRPGSRRVGRTGPSARCSRDLEETAGQRRSEGIMRPDPARQGRTVRRNASAPSTTQAGIIAWVQPDVRAIQTCR